VYVHLPAEPGRQFMCRNAGEELRLPVETSPDGKWTYLPRVPRCAVCGVEPAPVETVEVWTADGSGA
jgi:hypothetical protein